MSQKPRALRICVNCFLPGTLGREPRSLSQRSQQCKQMPSTYFKYSEKENFLLGHPERAGREKNQKFKKGEAGRRTKSCIK